MFHAVHASRPLIKTALAIVTLVTLPLGGSAQAMRSPCTVMPALPEPGFTHFPYAEADAPKGGRLRLCLLGTFDSLNPFNLKAGSTAQGIEHDGVRDPDGALRRTSLSRFTG